MHASVVYSARVHQVSCKSPVHESSSESEEVLREERAAIFAIFSHPIQTLTKTDYVPILSSLLDLQ